MEKNILKDLINKALKEVKLEEQKRPDYPDVDGDGDRKEPMEKAFKDKKAKKSEAKNASSTSCKKDSDCGNSRYDKCFKGTCMDTAQADSEIKLTEKSLRNNCYVQNIGWMDAKKSGVAACKRRKNTGQDPCLSRAQCLKYASKTAGPSIDKMMREAEMTAGAENTKFTIKVDVSNKQSETKLGIRIQLTPKDGMLEPDVRDKLEVAITKKLNTSLGEFDIQVSKDTDVPDPAIIGFFIPLSQIKNMIVKSIKGEAAPTNGAPTPPPPARPTPPAPAVPPVKPATPVAPATTNEVILKEMRVRDLKEISKVVIKEDFYAFINAGQNVLRTMEGKGMDNGKKYLEYLVKHNIM